MKFIHKLSRFVDRDMYMRYRGGGVGHSFVPIVNHDPVVDPTEADELENEDNDVEDPGKSLPSYNWNTADA